MDLGSKTIAIYYHMPFIVHEDGEFYANPVMGTFIESLVPFFKSVVVLGFECVVNHDPITYRLSNKKIEFISVGPEGQFWDYFNKMNSLKKIVRKNRNKIQILLLRVPSPLAYAVWKYAGRPDNTVLLFIGNPFFTPAYSNNHGYMYFFRKWRSYLHDKRMKTICRKSSAIVLANSHALVDLWGSKLEISVSLINTSSISKNDIIMTGVKKKFTELPYKLLFVGRICYDKGIRELFSALRKLNQKNSKQFILDIVGSIGDLGGNNINQLIQQYDIFEYVKYHGTLPFGEILFKFYRNADAYILPSYHEGMPHTIWEAMSQGAPVISTPVGGVGDFFVDGEDILFIEIRDSKSIVEAVQKLKSDNKLQSTLIKNGFKKVSKVTRESQSKKIVAIMKKNWDLKFNL